MIKEYYINVYKSNLGFNSNFFTNYLLSHVNKYISKPEEMITKFNKILKSQEEEKESQINNINILNINIFNYAIKCSYYTFYQLIGN